MLTIYKHAGFHMFRSNGSLLTAIKSKLKQNLRKICHYHICTACVKQPTHVCGAFHMDVMIKICDTLHVPSKFKQR
jgi:hypothetical protein